jgi:predicted NAD/FAD-binding protein
MLGSATPAQRPLEIAVIGSGISGMSAAWLLSQRHRVTVYEKEPRAGGHSNTANVETAHGIVPVDTGFIVYNEANYPNLTALFRHLDVPTKASNMSFAASFNDGAFEYSGGDLRGLFAQKRNLFRPRFWSMLKDLLRFYREAPAHAKSAALMPLGEYLERHRYGKPFCEDHLLPMAAAIWSSTPAQLAAYPTAAFLRFCENHGLMKISGRPLWRTVSGGSRVYVERLTARYRERLHLATPAARIVRDDRGVRITTVDGQTRRFDQVVIATHADQALRLLEDPSDLEWNTLARFRYQPNIAVLHNDPALMPRRRATWSSWNYMGSRERNGKTALCVTYWMNRLQGIPERTPLFVTLNPSRAPRAESVLRVDHYEHPIFDAEAIRAQERLWSLQGARNTWFCGAYFGSGFHEDGLQSGLAVAEALGGEKRPWQVANESGRIRLPWPALHPVPHPEPVT